MGMELPDNRQSWLMAPAARAQMASAAGARLEAPAKARLSSIASKDDGMTFLIVFLGGGLGAAMRHGFNLLISFLVLRSFGADFPVATLAVNVSGCFLMGAIVGYLAFTRRDFRTLAIVFEPLARWADLRPSRPFRSKPSYSSREAKAHRLRSTSWPPSALASPPCSAAYRLCVIFYDLIFVRPVDLAWEAGYPRNTLCDGQKNCPSRGDGVPP